MVPGFVMALRRRRRERQLRQRRQRGLRNPPLRPKSSRRKVLKLLQNFLARLYDNKVLVILEALLPTGAEGRGRSGECRMRAGGVRLDSTSRGCGSRGVGPVDTLPT